MRARRSTQKWDADHQTLKRTAEARGKRNIEDGHHPAALQTVERTTARKVEGSRGPGPGPGPETVRLVHILMIEDADTGQAAALPMVPGGNEAEVGQGAEGNPTECKGLGQKAEEEGPGQDLVHVPIVEAVKGPVTEELVVGLEIENENDVKAVRRKKGRRKRRRAGSYIALNAGNLETSKLD